MSENNINDGGPAFPIPGLQDHEEFNGMTLRDYFAAKAMTAAITGHIAHYGHAGETWTPIDICDYAYEVADTMLAAREKQS